MPDTPDVTERLAATERWFYRRGLPFFVEDYRSATDVWTRASPFLLSTFVVLVALSAASFDDAFGAVAGLILVVAALGGYAWWNVRRGRPWKSLPRRVSWPVLAGFVVVPTVVVLATTRDVEVALDTAVLALLLLAAAWVITRFAVIAVLGWAVRYTVRGLGDLYRMATRALPMLLLFMTFLFINASVWQVAGSLPGERLRAVVLVFVVLGVSFIVGRLPEEIRRIESSTDKAGVVAACAGTPLAELVEDLPGLDTPVDLAFRQRANTGLVMAVAQGVQVSLFALVVWAFFVLFGALTVSMEQQARWLGALPESDALWAWGEGYGVTWALLRVAAFLAAFAGFYVAIYTAVDSVYRENFYDRIRHDLERSLSVRRAYLSLHRRLEPVRGEERG